MPEKKYYEQRTEWKREKPKPNKRKNREKTYRISIDVDRFLINSIGQYLLFMLLNIDIIPAMPLIVAFIFAVRIKENQQ